MPASMESWRWRSRSGIVIPIRVAIRRVTATDTTNPARARRKPPNRVEEFLILRIKSLPLQRATIAAGTTSHFKRQAATSPAETIFSEESKIDQKLSLD